MLYAARMVLEFPAWMTLPVMVKKPVHAPWAQLEGFVTTPLKGCPPTTGVLITLAVAVGPPVARFVVGSIVN
jgi:hypothetical protein